MGIDNGLLHAVTTSFIDPYERIFIGGRFTAYNGITRNNVARLMGLPGMVTNDDPDVSAHPTFLSEEAGGDSSIMDIIDSLPNPWEHPNKRKDTSNTKPSLSIHPNPACGSQITLSLHGMGSGESQIIIRMEDLNGRVVKELKKTVAGEFASIDLNLYKLGSGLYVVRILGSKGIIMNEQLIIYR